MNKDYYIVNLIDKFNESMTPVNYDLPIYRRNPIIDDKLTLNHPEMIELFCRLLKPKNYLEMGTQYGETLKRILPIALKCYAVDVEKTIYLTELKTKYKERLNFYETTTSNFLVNILPKLKINFDCVFIDADHTHQASLSDFVSILPFVNEDGLIFLHDTYPASVELAKPRFCGDSYKTAEYIRKNYSNQCEILTLPFNPGLSIIRKCTKQMLWLDKQ